MDNQTIYNYVYKHKKGIDVLNIEELSDKFGTDDIDEMKDNLTIIIHDTFPLKFKNESIYKKSIVTYNEYIKSYKKYMIYLVTKKLINRKIRLAKKKGEEVGEDNIWDEFDDCRWDDEVESIMTQMNALERSIMRKYSSKEQQNYFNDVFNTQQMDMNSMSSPSVNGFDSKIGAYDNTNQGFSSYASVVQSPSNRINNGFSIYNDIQSEAGKFINNTLVQNMEYQIEESLKLDTDNTTEWDNQNFIQKNKNKFNKVPDGFMLTNNGVIQTQNNLSDNRHFDLNAIMEKRNSEFENSIKELREKEPERERMAF